MAINTRRSFIKIIPFVGVGLLAACSEKPKAAAEAAPTPAPAPMPAPAVAAAPAPAAGALPMVAADDATAVALGYSPTRIKSTKQSTRSVLTGRTVGIAICFRVQPPALPADARYSPASRSARTAGAALT